METVLHKRFMEVFQWTNLTSNGLAVKLGMNSRSCWNYTNNGREPSVKCLRKICEAFPEIREEWLFRGDGTMLKSIEPEENYKSPDVKEVKEEEVDKVVSVYEKMIAVLTAQIEELKQQLREMNKHCSSYEEQNKILVELMRESKKK